MKEQSIKNREAIIKAINEGANTRKKIVDKTKLSYAVVSKQINKLIKEGIIDKGAIVDERKTERREEKNKNKQKILEAIEQGATTCREIVNITGLHRNTVKRYVDELEQDGTIDKGKIIDGRRKGQNKQKILRAVEQGANTYAEIVNITGLSRDTVRINMNELRKEGIIDEKTIKDGRIIENERRKEQSKQKVLRAVEQGASTYAEIENITGLSNNTVRKYLRKLKQEGIIDAITDGRKIERMEKREQSKQKVLSAIEQGASTYVEIENITGLSYDTVRRYVNELKQEGIIDAKAIVDEKKLKNERRKEQSKQKVLRAVEQGASTYAEIVNITGLHRNTVRRNMNELKKEGIIDKKTIKDGRKIENKRRKEQSKQKILRAIEQGASTYLEIVNITGLHMSTVIRNVNELKKEGKIDKKAITDGRKIEKERKKGQSESKLKVLSAVEQGASTYAEIEDITGLSNNTVRKYLDELRQEGKIDKKAITDGRKIENEKRKEQNKPKVLSAVEQGATTYAEIENITGLSHSTIKKYLDELRQEGIIDAIIDGRRKREGKASSKIKPEVIEEKLKAFDKKLRQNSVTATETLIFRNLILDNSSTINANTVEMAIVGILKTGGKDGFKMACDFYDKCIELVDDDKDRKVEIQRKIKPYLEWHKSKITAAKMISRMLDQGGVVSLYDVAASTGLDITEVLKIKELLESQRRRAMQRKSTATKNNGNSGQER